MVGKSKVVVSCTTRYVNDDGGYISALNDSSSSSIMRTLLLSRFYRT